MKDLWKYFQQDLHQDTSFIDLKIDSCQITHHSLLENDRNECHECGMQLQNIDIYNAMPYLFNPFIKESNRGFIDLTFNFNKFYFLNPYENHVLNQIYSRFRSQRGSGVTGRYRNSFLFCILVIKFRSLENSLKILKIDCPFD